VQAHSSELADFINSFEVKNVWKTAFITHDQITQDFFNTLLEKTKVSDGSHVKIFDNLDDAENWIHT
jgi:hypothetical protein